jgi:hypothetical protein
MSHSNTLLNILLLLEAVVAAVRPAIKLAQALGALAVILQIL